MDNNKEILEKLEQTNKLMERLVAIQLFSNGATQREIASNLDVSVGYINKIIKGVKRSN